MEVIHLKNGLLEAQFAPEEGMRLMSFKRGGVEVLAQPTQLIGPHFGERHAGTLPQLKSEYSAQLRQQGHRDPFFHGVAGYAPWKVEVVENTIRARLSGKDEWKGIPLATLEGQSFVMEMTAHLSSEALILNISVVGDSDSLVGLQCDFVLPDDRGVIANVDLNQQLNTLFHSPTNPLESIIVLETARYTLHLRTFCKNVENSWLLKREPGTSVVTLMPLAAKSPHRPILTVNALRIELIIANSG